MNRCCDTFSCGVKVPSYWLFGITLVIFAVSGLTFSNSTNS